MALLEKEKADLQEALVASRAEAKKNADDLEIAREEKRLLEEAKVEAEKAQQHAEECRARGRETI